MKYVLCIVAYTAILSLVSVAVNAFVLRPWHVARGHSVNMLTVGVYTAYFCLKYTAIGAAVAGLTAALVPALKTWKQHGLVILVLALIVASVQAAFFPLEGK